MHSEDTDYLWESWERPSTDIFINVGMPGSFLKRKKIATDTIDFIQNRLNSPHLSNVMPYIARLLSTKSYTYIVIYILVTCKSCPWLTD
ncbi:hypothetical protein RBTH_07997 [Bacillus thuringiensis serovar israelensis ATCC 35646]|nr:hypothetical protein RBTH_07997 [Bacillus thuringiensis serovar israelensis ATCC 35646]